jgi:hypothetical protein
MVGVKQDSEGVTGFRNINAAIFADAQIVDRENEMCKNYGYDITMTPEPQSGQ